VRWDPQREIQGSELKLELRTAGNEDLGWTESDGGQDAGRMPVLWVNPGVENEKEEE